MSFVGDGQLKDINSAVVLLSGGMDSATLLRYVKKEIAGDDIRALSFIYGQKHVKELTMARWQAENAGIRDHKQVDLSALGLLTSGGSALTDEAISVPDLDDISDERRKQPPTYVPNRNMVFLSMAAAYAESCGIKDVFYGAQAQDNYGYWDCTVDFVTRINDALALNRLSPVRVHAPFVGKTKAEVLKLGLELGVDFEHTWTCYRGGDDACGTCPSCVERDSAFARIQSE